MGAAKKTVLAVGSAGVYWEDLMLLAPTLVQSDTHYATTSIEGPVPLHAISVDLLPDCRLSHPVGFLTCLIASFRLVRTHRPDVVVSTGAAPGLACILAARTLGARTLWIDGLIHRDKISACGNIARFVAHGCWTQWEHLADGKRLRYFGSTM